LLILRPNKLLQTLIVSPFRRLITLDYKFDFKCENRLELSVSSYEKFRYHHHFQGTSENWTVLCCCIRHGLTFTFLLRPAPPIWTRDIRRRLYMLLTLTLTYESGKVEK